MVYSYYNWKIILTPDIYRQDKDTYYYNGYNYGIKESAVNKRGFRGFPPGKRHKQTRYKQKGGPGGFPLGINNKIF